VWVAATSRRAYAPTLATPLFRKIFAPDEMNDDLLLVPARHYGHVDTSMYEEMLPSAAQ